MGVFNTKRVLVATTATRYSRKLPPSKPSRCFPGKPLLAPVYFVGIAPMFYVILALIGVSPEAARANGYFFSHAPSSSPWLMFEVMCNPTPCPRSSGPLLCFIGAIFHASYHKFMRLHSSYIRTVPDSLTSTPKPPNPDSKLDHPWHT